MEGEARVLIVEDDPRLAELVREYLVENGFEVHVEPRGDLAPQRVLDLRPDVLILDLMLPGMDGLEVCRRVRPTFEGAILMLTARGDEIEEVVGLEVGADDYLAKPVRPRVLLARLNSLLRRSRGAAISDGAGHDRDDSRKTLRVGDLVVIPDARIARLGGAELDLTTAEFDLLVLLATHAGEVLPRDEIYLQLRGIEYDGLDRSIDLRVARLRRKLGDDAKQPNLLKSVRGIGYLLARGS